MYLATGQSSSTQLEEEEEEEGREGKGRESVVHVVIYEKRRSFSAFPLRFWDPNDELNRLVPRYGYLLYLFLVPPSSISSLRKRTENEL